MYLNLLVHVQDENAKEKERRREELAVGLSPETLMAQRARFRHRRKLRGGLTD
jgi:hypothetical protein